MHTESQTLVEPSRTDAIVVKLVRSSGGGEAEVRNDSHL